MMNCYLFGHIAARFFSVSMTDWFFFPLFFLRHVNVIRLITRLLTESVRKVSSILNFVKAQSAS